MLPPSEEITLYIRHSVHIALVNEAWRYLLQHARKISKVAKVQPHELIISELYRGLTSLVYPASNILCLVTRSVKGQTYTLRDFTHIPGHSLQHHNTFGLTPGRPGGAHNGHMQHHRGGFHQPHPFAHHSAFAPPPPKMLYLFTSPASDNFAPFWSENPSAIALPPNARPGLPRTISERTGWYVLFLW